MESSSFPVSGQRSEIPLLRTSGLTKSFRRFTALSNHSVSIYEREIIGIIGPNGSGKSTLFNLVSGFSTPTSGLIEFRGKPIQRLTQSEIVSAGIARTFQGSRLFGSLTCEDNVLAAAQLRHPIGAAPSLFRGRQFRDRAIAAERIARELLDFMGLRSKANQLAAELAYGDQRRLEIARALATRPQMLLLDEPAAGLDSHETKHLVGLIREIRDRYATAIVVVEHDMDLIMSVCERIQVFSAGEVICLGEPEQVRTHPRVREVYLGDA